MQDRNISPSKFKEHEEEEHVVHMADHTPRKAKRKARRMAECTVLLRTASQLNLARRSEDQRRHTVCSLSIAKI